MSCSPAKKTPMKMTIIDVVSYHNIEKFLDMVVEFFNVNHDDYAAS